MLITEYKCKINTAMFLHGLNTSEVELRETPFKSLMRFEFRALHLELDGNELLKEEEKIFGGINQVVQKSCFTIQVKYDKSKLMQYKAFLMPHKTEKNGNGNKRVDALRPGSEFRVLFILKGNKDEDQNKNLMCKIENIFELSSILGGVGKRTRRGAGSFSIIQKNSKCYKLGSKDIDLTQFILDKINDLISCELQSNVKREELKTFIMLNECRISNTGKRLARLRRVEIIKVNSCKSFDDVLYAIGCATHKSLEKETYQNCEKINLNNVKNLSEMVGVALGRIKPSRLASPIYVSVTENNSEKYVVISRLTYSNNSYDSEMLETIQDVFVNGIRKRVE